MRTYTLVSDVRHVLIVRKCEFFRRATQKINKHASGIRLYVLSLRTAGDMFYWVCIKAGERSGEVSVLVGY